jgi:hypothetical protein
MKIIASTIEKDLDLNGLSLDMICGRTLRNYLIH